MAAFNFPASPSVGDLYTANDTAWYWDGTLWQRQPSFWVRPSEWPALPTVAVDEQKLVALVQVSDTTSEFVALLCAGAYTVDWGDGSSENVAADVKAQHAYTYASIGTAALSYGYKTVTVVVTPQAGQSLTTVDFQQRHSSVGAAVTYSPRWLDVVLNAPNCTQLVVGGDGPTTQLNQLQQFTLLHHGLTTMAGLFEDVLFRSVTLNTAGVTSLASTFYACRALTDVTLLNTASVTDMSAMFGECSALTTPPLLNTASVTDMHYMFGGCSALTTPPLLNTASVTNMSAMFDDCRALATAPALDTSNVTDMSGVFGECVALATVPLWDTALVTTWDYAFYGCKNLVTLPALDMSSVTSLIDAFSGCVALTRILATGLRYGGSLYGLGLSATALDEIFTNLGTAAGAQTLDITDCTGAASCTRSIATAKGWTITG